MAEGLDAATEEATEQALKLPSAYAILFALICVVAAATWVVPAGAFTRELSEALGKHVAVPGTYHLVPSVPQGLVAIFLAPVRGLYATVDVAAFLFCIGGFLQVGGKDTCAYVCVHSLPAACRQCVPGWEHTGSHG
jgi:uncharacterized ion transporter superfamily protein YfcC